MIYLCNRCGKSFNHKNDHRRHINRKNPCKKSKNIHGCSHCHKVYSSRSNLNKHMRRSCKVLKDSIKRINENENDENYNGKYISEQLLKKNGVTILEIDTIRGGYSTNDNEDITITATTIIETLDDKFHCPYCKKIFSKN